MKYSPNGARIPIFTGLFGHLVTVLLVSTFAAQASSAGVAQLVEQLICNHQVGGSSPFTGSNKYKALTSR